MSTWYYHTGTHSLPQISIFRGTFIDILHCLALILTLTLIQQPPTSNSNLHPILTSTFKPDLNPLTVILQGWGPAKSSSRLKNVLCHYQVGVFWYCSGCEYLWESNPLVIWRRIVQWRDGGGTMHPSNFVVKNALLQSSKPKLLTLTVAWRQTLMSTLYQGGGTENSRHRSQL